MVIPLNKGILTFLLVVVIQWEETCSLRYIVMLAEACIIVYTTSCVHISITIFLMEKGTSHHNLSLM